MRGKWVVVIGCLVSGGGCHLYHAAARVIVHEPAQYMDEKHLEHELRKDARNAWAEVCRQYPQRSFTDDFVEGFCDGYVDYLDSGGNAQIPAVPPFKYRRYKFYSQEGHERIRQYFLGFKYGMDVAIDTGCRTFLTVPVVLPEVPPPSNPNITILPPPETAPVLPPPRLVPGPGKSPDPSPAPTPPAGTGKTPDKDKPPSEPVGVKIPPVPGIPSGTVAAPPLDLPGTRTLVPISAPAADSPGSFAPTGGRSTVDGAAESPRGPRADLPPARPPVADLPIPDRSR